MKENFKCRLLMGTYYIVVCVILAYAAYYLEASGFTPWQTGFIVSSASFAGGLLQGVSGRLADTDPAWSWKRQIAVYSLASLFMSASTLIVGNRLWVGASFGLTIAAVMMMMPLVNSACFYYVNHGINVDYGIARGTGSVTYAVASLVLGGITAARGAAILPICFAAAFAMLFASVMIMPYMGGVTNGKKRAAKTDRKGFTRKYPVFILMAVGVAFGCTFHIMTNTFLIKILENVGGGPDNLGIALSIGAAVELPALFLYSRVEGKHGLSAAALLAAGCFFFTLKGVLLLAAASAVMIYFIQLLQSVSYGLVTAAKASYAHETVAVDDDNTGQAVMSMTDSFGTVAGSLLGGLLLSGGGTKLMLGAGTAIAAGGMIITMIAAKKSGEGGKRNE